MCFFKFKVFKFGGLTARQFILFESKYVGSILFFWFKGDGWQDRFHTHAFNAISCLIYGTYLEGILTSEGNMKVVPRVSFLKFFPRNHYHKIGPSKGCCTLLIAGPWRETWEELHDDGRRQILTWGRKELK